MNEYPKSTQLLRSVSQRLYLARIGVVCYRAFLGFSILFAALLIASRLTGLIPDWFSLKAVFLVPIAAALTALVGSRRPSASEVAHRVDVHEGTRDLFLTLTLLDQAAGEYKPLVGRDAESKATAIEPTAVVSFGWRRRVGYSVATLGMLAFACLFLPTFDPFGKVAAAEEAAARQEELAKDRRATQVRKSELAKSDLEAMTSEAVDKALEDLKGALQRMEPQNREENARALGIHQKLLGAKWRLGAEQLKDLLSRKPMEQRFGAMTASQARQWADELRKGESEGLEEELDDLQNELAKIAEMQDPLKRTEAIRRLQKRLEDVLDLAKEDVNSKPLAAALERAMKELETARSGAMTPEQREAISESMKLAELELKQLAQAVRDMKELEKALETMQMARQLNNEDKLDGAMMADAESLDDYRELYSEMMAELGYDVAMLSEEEMAGLGEGLGAGEVEPMAQDDSVKTDFQDTTSKSAIQKGKLLLSLKTKGVTEADDGDVELQYSAIVTDLKQSVSDAIDQEQIPPGYHDGIKKYFDSLDRTAPGGRE